MESLRIEKKDVYQIEVNDNGDFIEFDLSDIGLGIKCVKALDEIDNIIKETEIKQKEILQKEYSKNDSIVSQQSRDLMNLEEESFIKCRKAMDTFLGQGACQKIFGNWNSYDMYDKLLNELTRPRKELNGKSHFDKMQITSMNFKNRIMEKYKKNKKKVI